MMHTWIPAERQLAYMTSKQVEAIDKERALVVLPTASIAQHGHHLPLATDTPINNLLLGQALRHLSADAPVYCLPPVCYGHSPEHLGFPGTLSLSTATYMAVLRDLGVGLHSSGFKRIVLYNTHRGNAALNDITARQLRADFQLQVFCLTGTAGANFPEITPQERAHGLHAAELETSLLLAATPDLVHANEYTHHSIADVLKPGTLLPENGPATYAWQAREISPSGVIGDPRPATADNGARWIAAAALKIAEALTAMLDFKPADSQFAAPHEPGQQ